MVISSGELIGEMNVIDDGKKLKIKITRGNCLAVFLYTHNVCGERQDVLYCFFHDENHLETFFKEKKRLFSGIVSNIKINTRYKEALTLLPYLTQCGYKVTCYYR